VLNLKQKLVVWTGLALIVAMGVYPPWVEALDTTWGKGTWLQDTPLMWKVGPRAGAYGWIFLPPEVPKWVWTTDSPLKRIGGFWNPSIDVTRLLIQWAMVCLVAGGLVWTLKDKPSITVSSQASQSEEASDLLGPAPWADSMRDLGHRFAEESQLVAPPMPSKKAPTAKYAPTYPKLSDSQRNAVLDEFKKLEKEGLLRFKEDDPPLEPPPK